MYLESLKIFCDVVRRRSFSRAAAANEVSQSAVSQSVSQLERSLGVKLIDRSQRPFKLTPAGRVYYEGCRGVVERYYAIEREVRGLSGGECGTVRVAAIYSVGLGSMSGYVQQFARLYPQAKVSLAYLHPDRVYESVLEEEADLGLVSYPQAKRGLAVVDWRREPMAVVAAPSHPLAAFPKLKAADLEGQAFVAFADDLRIGREIDAALRRHACQVNPVLSFDNIETIKRAVEIGEAVSILPIPTVQREIAAGTLVSIPLAAPRLERPLGIIYRKTTSLPHIAEEFISLIRGRSEAPSVVEADEEAVPGCLHPEVDPLGLQQREVTV